MDILIIILLIVAAAILLLVELFITPGISVAGFLSAGCFIYANWHAFAYLGTGGGIITLVASAVVCSGALVWFMRSKTLDRIALTTNITSSIDRSAETGVQIGDEGIATTRLALIGYAKIGGQIVEVKSDDGFIDEKTPVKVCRLTDGMVFVCRNTATTA